MMAAFLNKLCEEIPDRLELPKREVAFVWIAPNKLHLQSYLSLKNYFSELRSIKPIQFEDITDNALKPNEVLFVKIENDGYSLGAQRRPIAGEQFTEALNIIEQFKKSETIESPLVHAVLRKDIAESGDYSLSGERYRFNDAPELSDYPFISLSELVDISTPWPSTGQTPLLSCVRLPTGFRVARRHQCASPSGTGGE
jgi:hypothetical protein